MSPLHVVQDQVDTIRSICIGISAHQKLELLSSLVKLLGYESLAVFGDCFDEVSTQKCFCNQLNAGSKPEWDQVTAVEALSNGWEMKGMVCALLCANKHVPLWRHLWRLVSHPSDPRPQKTPLNGCFNGCMNGKSFQLSCFSDNPCFASTSSVELECLNFAYHSQRYQLQMLQHWRWCKVAGPVERQLLQHKSPEYNGKAASAHHYRFDLFAGGASGSCAVSRGHESICQGGLPEWPAQLWAVTFLLPWLQNVSWSEHRQNPQGKYAAAVLLTAHVAWNKACRTGSTVLLVPCWHAMLYGVLTVCWYTCMVCFGWLMHCSLLSQQN